MFFVPRECRRPKEVWDLLVWLQTDEAQVMYANLNNNVPNTLSALKNAELRQGPPYKQKYIKFVELADTPNSGYFPVIPVSGLYNSEMLTARDVALSGDKTPEQALKDVKKRVQRELNKYR